MKWLEVTLATSAENAEAVADVLARYALGGTAISGQTDRPDLPLTVRAYLSDDMATPTVQESIRQAIWHLSQISALPEPAFRWVEGEDWAESWKRHFQPMAVGRRVIVVPAWMRPQTTDRIPIYLDPGMAFGTGAHPSTRLCLQALEEAVRPGDRVIDVGCGSGILGIAAALFGAAQVVGCDTDEHAVAASRRCAELNRVEDRVEILPGRWQAVADRRAEGPPADVLVANILAPVLAELLGQGMAGLVRPGGRVILSGILLDQRDQVDRAAADAGLSPEPASFEQDWCALVYRREGAAQQAERRPVSR